MLSLKSIHAFLLLVPIGLIAAAPAPVAEADAPATTPCKEHILCIDGLNECGVRWGDCYDTCKPHLRPTPPPCKPTTTVKPTKTTAVTTTTSASTECQILCIDGIDKCGHGWGGCYDICKPWMRPTPPATCESKSELPTAKPTATCKPLVKCITAVNSCGVRYGGCYDTCTPSLRPSPPPCPATSAKPTTPPPVHSTTKPPVSPTSTATPKDDCRTRTVCVDAVNACGQKYGGCFADCKPWPLTPPPCPSSTSTKKPITRLPRVTPVA